MQTSLGHLDCLDDYYLLMWLDKQPATCLYQVTLPPNQLQEPTPLAELSSTLWSRAGMYFQIECH